MDKPLIISADPDELWKLINDDQQRVRMNRLFQRISLLTLFAAASILLSSAAKSLNQGYLVPSGNTRINQQLLGSELKICALTFDDGPDVRYTMQVHDILRNEGIHATFFVLGRNVDRYPEQVIALAEYGHEIGNHSYTHRDMLKLSQADIRGEISETADILGKLGIKSRWFRPPYGSFNRTVVNIAAEQGLDTMLWSVDPEDWMRPGAAVIQKRVVSRTGPGAVVLMHSTVGETVEALPGIIRELRAEGYTFVTASEWQQLVSGGVTLDKLHRSDDYSLPLNLREEGFRDGPGIAPMAGTISGSLPMNADVWQRVPAGKSGDVPRQITVYANFVDDIDLRRVLTEGIARRMIETDSTIGNGLLRVLAGLPPQQIVAVVGEPGSYREDRGSVEVQIIDTPVVENGELIAAAAEQALASSPDLPQAGEPAMEAAAMPAQQQAGPVAVGSSQSALSLNMASLDYAASLSPADDGSIAFVSFASSPDDEQWRWLATYMQLCRLDNFGYADGYSAGRMPEGFPFAAGTDQQGRRRLELGMFSPARYLGELDESPSWFIPLRSTDFASLDTDSLFGGVSNGFREFMLIRHFSAGLQYDGPAELLGLPAGAVAAGFSGPDVQVLIIAAPRPGIELTLHPAYRNWQHISFDGQGRLESAAAGAAVSESGRLLILVNESDD